MRILHVAEALKGGPATHLAELISFQRKENKDVVLLCREEEAYLVANCGVRICGVRGVSRSVIGLLNLTRAIYRETKERKYDIVHLHSSFAGAVFRAFLPRRGAKIVYCSRGWSFTMKKAAWKLSLYAFLERLFAMRTDWIINISHHEQHSAERYGINAAKMSVIHNGISDRGYAERIVSDKISLLFVGRFDEQKGVDLLLEAFAALDPSEFELHLVGDYVLGGPPIAHFASENIFNHGWLPKDEVMDRIAASDALVVPSRWEGFGFVAIEALSKGRPVVASKVGGLTDIVENGTNGFLFEPDSVPALVEAIGRLKNADFNCLCLAARQTYLTKFQSALMGERISRIYDDLISERG